MRIGAAALRGGDPVPTPAGVLLFGESEDIEGLFPGYRVVFSQRRREGELLLDSRESGWSGNLSDFFVEVTGRIIEDRRLRPIWSSGILADDPRVLETIAGSFAGEMSIRLDGSSVRVGYRAGRAPTDGVPAMRTPPEALDALRLLIPPKRPSWTPRDAPVHRKGFGA